MIFREPGDQPWDMGRWDVAGVIAGESQIDDERACVPIHTESSNRQFLWPDFRLELFRDDAGSYYHNLMGIEPRVFVLCREKDSGKLEPFQVTLSYDEAAAYTEVEEEVFAVPMPPEVYRWVENFVLEHYVPEKRRKRKREDWKKSGLVGHAQGQ
jgi:hypothetical protein